MNIQTMAAIRPLWETTGAGEDTVVGHISGPTLPFADIFQSTIETVRETEARRRGRWAAPFTGGVGE